MEYKLGFIGAGKMVNHIVSGLLKDHEMQEKILVTGRSLDKLEKFRADKQVEVSTDYNKLADCDIIINGVSSNQILSVFGEIKNHGKKDALYISIAAGVTIEEMETILGDRKIIRSMPNIAVSVQEGVMVMSANKRLIEADRQFTESVFGKIGTVAWVDESLMKYTPSLTGSSPTYGFLMIEAMADQAVSVGFSREQAYKLAAQAVIGAGKLVLETGTHPGVLKDQITTSGGSTIQGVMELENQGFRNSVIKAMKAVNEANKK
ncbi:pyrroline-5-carboxylate reductase [Salinicoccus sesuvii]|uniref:Pyrroline-5-carboxylate reductase n=1 Tax=Salinicoccus sesuvii TaxID=868281 RepID=A0ABV7N1M6_9STAP